MKNIGLVLVQTCLWAAAEAMPPFPFEAYPEKPQPEPHEGSLGQQSVSLHFIITRLRMVSFITHHRMRVQAKKL